MADKKFSEFTSGGDVQVNDIVVGLRSSTNYKFNFPGSGIKDANGNYLFSYSSVSSAVNYPVLTNAAAGNPAVYGAAGVDANIGINEVPKGSGGWSINNTQYMVGIINDNTMATATATNLTSALAVKTYIDNQIVADTGLSWNNSTGSTTFTATVNNGYIINTAGTTTVTLPTTAPVGSLVAIQGSAQQWVLAAGAGQTIQMGSSATSTAGTLASVNQYDCVEVICIVANTTWAVRFALSAGLTIT